MTEILSTDIMHIGFLKKECFSGSSEGMRYRLEKFVYPEEDPEGGMVTEEDGTQHPAMRDVTVLRATVWPEPFSYDHTPEGEKTTRVFDFSEEGVEEARTWLNAEKARDWEALRLPFRGERK